MGTVNQTREVLTWQAFGDATRQLAQQVVDSGYQPDLILSIARGGLFAAGAISYALGIKNLHVMNVEFYTDISETLPDPVLLAPLLDIDSIAGRRVLVADDVADSGRTLQLVMDILLKHGAEVRTAVLYTKPTSIYRVDYVWKDTDAWIVFPWSALPPVTAR